MRDVVSIQCFVGVIIVLTKPIAPIVSVLMPTYKQAAFIRRAISSLQAQTLTSWELLIVDDGSPDETAALIEPLLSDERIHYIRLYENRGFGAALNVALDIAQASFIAYLPSDDVYYANHLQSLVALLERNPEAIAAFTGVRHHYNRMAIGHIEGYALQPVQVMHRAIPERWMERDELTTDDMERMYWHKLRPCGTVMNTGMVSCEWVDHPHQRHKLLQEPVGGLNSYRAYYEVKQPLIMQTTMGNFIDEVTHYHRFRERSDTPFASDGLKILLVGELAYNPERILALEERGHKLYGLWMPEPYWYNTVGPLPFGHVEEVPHANWQETIQAVRDIQPDIIYALLNWQAVPFAHEVLMICLREHWNIPFIWHFKEGPFICLEKGTWDKLIDLHTRSDGQIYSSPEMRDWFATLVPDILSHDHHFVLDGDLPKANWLHASEPTPLLSEADGAFHTVVPGRPIGLHPEMVAELAAQNIHLHFYGDFTQGQWVNWIAKARRLAPQHLHIHKNVDQEQWVSEFSRYDAGWLHFLKSENGGDLRRATWDDLNYPARIATLVMAGLPLLQYDNTDAVFASATLARDKDIGLFFTETRQLRAQLADRSRMRQLRANVWSVREQFTFDYHADDLIAFFRHIQRTKNLT